MNSIFYRCEACGHMGPPKRTNWYDACEGLGECATAKHLPLGHGSTVLRVVWLRVLSMRFAPKECIPGPYYRLSLPIDYYEGEQRKVTFKVRKVIKSFVTEQLQDGSTYGFYTLTGDSWDLHKDILEHIAPMLSRNLEEMIAEAELDEEKFERMCRESERTFWERLGASSAFIHPLLARRDAFATLQLDEMATADAIQKRYHSLAKQYHPDVGGSEEQMKRLNHAYQVLRQEVRS